MPADSMQKLAQFGYRLLLEHRTHMGDIDGAFVQDTAVATGVLVSRQVTESCGEHCVCAEIGLPTECFFIAAGVLAAGAEMEKNK